MIDYVPRLTEVDGHALYPHIHSLNAVEVYRNLNRPDGPWFSVRWRGRVIGHCRAITLLRCTLVVQPGGRDRVLATGRKNVHAWVRGILTPHNDDLIRGVQTWHDLCYDPRVNRTFVDSAGQPVYRAGLVTLAGSGCAFSPYEMEQP